jgi:hypothetical protein
MLVLAACGRNKWVFYLKCAQGLLEFLAYEPFYEGRAWAALLLRRGEAGAGRLLPLCALLRGVMLRRTKDDVGALSPRRCCHAPRISLLLVVLVFTCFAQQQPIPPFPLQSPKNKLWMEDPVPSLSSPPAQQRHVSQCMMLEPLPPLSSGEGTPPALLHKQAASWSCRRARSRTAGWH